MLCEMGNINKQTEAATLTKNEFREERTLELSDVTELPHRELAEGTKVLQPDMELIKTQSLESVKQSNIEKMQISVNEDHEFRELTEEEKQKLRENTRLSDSAIENIRADIDGNYHLKCLNEKLAGKVHDISGIKYTEKTITIDGIDILVVVPEFEVTFMCQIPTEMWESGDREIFKNCSEQLCDYLENYPEMKNQFNEQQLEQIMNGEPYIKGYTWHHSEIPGEMQLVKTKPHALSGHTGGNFIWCGGVR